MTGNGEPGGMYRPRRTRREALTGDIVTDLRGYSVVAQHIGHAFAARYGLGATDLHALIAVMEADRTGDPITPGRLGEQLNLSSGSMTALVDRLERAGHIRRDRDPADRRKVLLRYAERGARVAVEFFGPLGRRTDAVLDQFTDAELEVVQRFLRAVTEAMREHRDEVRAAPVPASARSAAKRSPAVASERQAPASARSAAKRSPAVASEGQNPSLGGPPA